MVGVLRMAARPARTLVIGPRSDLQFRAQCEVLTAIARVEAKPGGKGSVTRLPWRSSTAGFAKALTKHLAYTGWVPRPAAPWSWQHGPLGFEFSLDSDSKRWHGARALTHLLR